MKQKGIVLGFALLLALLLVLAWWIARPRVEVAGPEDTPVQRALPQPALPTDAAPPSGESATADSPAPAAERSALAGAPKSSTGSLIVHALWGDDRSPAADVVLWLHRSGADELFEQPSIATDAEGNARFTELAPGKVYAQCERGEGQWSGLVTVVAGEEAKAELTLEVGLNLSGSVVDAHGAPVPEAEVLVAGWAGGEAHVLARTAADGRFSLRCISTHCHVGARKPGYAATPLRQFTAGKGAQAEFTIVLGEIAAELAGSVLDPARQPVPGAVVQAGAERNANEKSLDGTITKAPMPARTVTDAQGRFQFRSLLPGPQPVSVRARGLAPWSGTVELERGREGKLTLQLEPGVTLRGTVRDSEGAKVSNATLYLGEWGELSHRGTQSDAEGEYLLEGLSTGELKLHAERDGKGSADATLQAVAGQSLRWDPVLSNGLVLKGRVLDADGQPVEHAMVEGQLEQWQKDDHWWGNANTDKQGRFTFENCVPGRTIRVSVRRKSVFPEFSQAGVAPGGEELLLRLPKEAWVYIQGKVLGPDDRPLPNVHVSPYMTGGNGSPAETANPATGEYRYGPYPPGEYQLTLQADGFPRLILGKRVLAPDEVWDVGLVRFQKGGTLLVNLTRADGQPLPEDAWISILDARGEWLDQLELKQGTGRAGPFASGSYLLQIAGAGLAARQQQVEVQTGVELRVDVQAQGGSPAVVVCRLPEDAGARRQPSLAIRDAAGATVWSGTAWSEAGDPQVSLALLPGSYRVEAQQGALHGSGTLTVVQGAEPSRVVLTLGP